jgi:hypothetical protein
VVIITDSSPPQGTKRPTRPQILTLAGRIANDKQRAEFLALIGKADNLHTAATELRRRAWAIYRQRDQEFSIYA